ncbi:hypothetical protein AAG570_013237 [Ranatra chinensis]|uniref:SANT and BTB domain-containing protein n=1 Tax=Ranatra chinensis TaxID=642074 RepID=A0ABD0YGP3_9HEMI
MHLSCVCGFHVALVNVQAKVADTASGRDWNAIKSDGWARSVLEREIEMSGNKLETLPCSEDGRGPQDVRKTVTGRHVTVKQVLDLVDWAHKLDAGESEVFGLDEPVDNALILDLHISHNNCQIPHPRKGQGGIDVPALSNNVNTKLSQLFNEEIFDSVLPYIVPDVQKPVEKRIRHEAAPPSKPRKPQPYSTSLTDVEVNIHVTDEYKNQRKDFKCPQSILVTKMSYFAEITSGQKLEEMDISVHCDIEVFEWIMNWVKQEPIDNCDRPVPDGMVAGSAGEPPLSCLQ